MENKDEYIAYLEDKIIQLEKRLAKFEPTEEEVNDMYVRQALKQHDHLSDSMRYTVPKTGQYTVFTNYGSSESVTIPSGGVLTFETLQNAVNMVMRR